MSSFLTPVALATREGTQDDLIVSQVLHENQYDLPSSFAEEDVILDFGAHIGSFAAACLQRGAGKVICYEPDPDNFELLRRNLSSFFERSRFILHQKALSSPGVKQLHFRSTRSLGSLTASSYAAESGDILVETVCLAEVLADHPKVRLLKMDAEGAEWNTFPHLLPGDLDGVQEIVGESHRVPVYAHEDIDAWLRPHGFETTSVGLVESQYPDGSFHNHIFTSKRTPTREGTVNVLLMRFPYGGSERGEVVDWVADVTFWAAREERIKDFKIGKLNDTQITMTRNEAVRIAQDLKYDLLIMVDSDMAPDWEPDGVKFLPAAFDFWWKHAGPCVVAAPYCGPPPDENPYAFLWRNAQNDTPEVEARLCMYTRDEAADLHGIKRVAALATGLILIDMKAFAAIEDPERPYFYYEFSDKRCCKKASTEDVTFSRDLDLAGVPMYVAWDSWAGHSKNKIVRKPQPIRLPALPGKFVKAVLRQHAVGQTRPKDLFPASCG